MKCRNPHGVRHWCGDFDCPPASEASLLPTPRSRTNNNPIRVSSYAINDRRGSASRKDACPPQAFDWSAEAATGMLGHIRCIVPTVPSSPARSPRDAARRQCAHSLPLHLLPSRKESILPPPHRRPTRHMWLSVYDALRHPFSPPKRRGHGTFQPSCLILSAVMPQPRTRTAFILTQTPPDLERCRMGRSTNAPVRRSLPFRPRYQVLLKQGQALAALPGAMLSSEQRAVPASVDTPLHTIVRRGS